MMDPNETLKALRYLMQGNFVESQTRELFEALDEWLSKGGFLPSDWVSKQPNQSADGKVRMTDAQRNRLWQMCANYNVPFREDDYFMSNKQQGIGFGWVEGWVGGKDGSGVTSRRTIYVGVSPEGESHT